jgi:HlyD family secretion protein
MSRDNNFTGEPPRPSLARKLAMFAGLASLVFAGLAVALIITPGSGVQVKYTSPIPAPTAPASAADNSSTSPWVVAAPGRVEPRTGQLRISASINGNIAAVSAANNDKVVEGEVLIRLDDKDARARLGAAEAEAAARKRERDAQPATAGREDVRKAEDAVFTAERAVTNARFELDDAIAADRKKGGNARGLSNARNRLADAKDKLRQEQAAFATAQSKTNVPAPNRFEAGLIAGRSDVILAESMLDKSRIRAPIAGTVLQISAKVGELVAASPEQPLVVMGDMSILRVRAEVDEQDVGKIKMGQRVFVKNTAYPGMEFEGKVTEMAPSLALPRMGSRGARRPTDVEVMEVVIDLEGTIPLLPGMRVDTFFRR